MLSRRTILFGLLGTVSMPLAAQVYQSTDSEGNVSYSDQPTEGSKPVDVPEPNVGDSVEVPPPAPEPVIEEKPQPVVEETPPELEGELIGEDKKKKKKRRRPRPEPRGGR